MVRAGAQDSASLDKLWGGRVAGPTTRGREVPARSPASLSLPVCCGGSCPAFTRLWGGSQNGRAAGGHGSTSFAGWLVRTQRTACLAQGQDCRPMSGRGSVDCFRWQAQLPKLVDLVADISASKVTALRSAFSSFLCTAGSPHRGKLSPSRAWELSRMATPWWTQYPQGFIIQFSSLAPM